MTHSTPNTKHLHETRWLKCIDAFDINPTALLQSRKYQRIYADDSFVYKLQWSEANNDGKLGGDLRHEYELLTSLNDMRGLPSPVQLMQHESAICVVYKRIDAQPLATASNPIPFLRGVKYWRIVIQVGGILLRLSLRGIVHNDVRTKNIMVDSTSHVWLIDFDLAERHSIPVALYRNFLKVRSPQGYAGTSYLYLLAWCIVPYIPRSVGIGIARLFGYRPTRWPGASERK